MKKNRKNGLEFVQEMIDQPGVPLMELITNNKLDKEKVKAILHRGSENEMGLYIFWWVNGEKALPIKTKVVLRGPHRGDIETPYVALHWETGDFPEECGQKGLYPLYIGKTTKIANRLSLHLSLGTDKWEDRLKGDEDPTKRVKGTLRKHTTSCQFRSGMEHLFNCQDRAHFMALFSQVRVSFFPIPNENPADRTDVKDRFYLEDLAVGYYRPWFNVDSER